MKIAFFSAVKSAAGLMQHTLRGVTLITALAAGGLAGSLSAAPSVTTLAGGNGGSGGAGYKDTNSVFALFKTPVGIAVDQGAANLYVADRDNNAVRMLDLVGNQTYTFATNQVNRPVGVVLDGDDNVYVLNQGPLPSKGPATNGYLLEFDYYGYLIATNALHLTNAAGLAIDPSGNIYVSSRTNMLTEIIGTNQLQTNFATVTISNAFIQGISVMPNGLIAACDYNRNGIYNIDPNTGNVTTNAGFNGQGDGTGIENRGVLNSKAQFFQPYGVAAAGDGTLIVCDFGNDRVKVVGASGYTTNFYGVSSNVWISPFPGWKDGTVSVPDVKGGVSGRCPAGVVLSTDGTKVFTTEDFYHTVRETVGTSFQPLPPQAPAAPLGLVATVATNGVGAIVVNLSWNPIVNQGVTNYIVERDGAVIATTTGTTATDANVQGGAIYTYTVQAANSGGVGEASAPVTVQIPVLPPPPPNIGWYDFEINQISGIGFSTLHPVTAGNPYVAHNPLNIAIDPLTNGYSTFFVTLPPFTNALTAINVTNVGSSAPAYKNNDPYPPAFGDIGAFPALTLSNGFVTIAAVNVNGANEPSSVNTASFLFQVGTPIISSPGNNAALITISDITTNCVLYYTLDGTDPTNAPDSQHIVLTNGVTTLSLNGTTNISLQVRGLGNGQTAGFQASGIAPANFAPGSFSPNNLTWGFAAGEGSSAFVAASGQTFYAPVTLTTVTANLPVYSMQFNMTISSSGIGLTNPAPAAGPFQFQSMLMKPTTPPTNASGSIRAFTQIPPYMFAGYSTSPVPPNELTNYDGTTFVNMVISNGNELAVGWIERLGFTNLYNTEAQTLIAFSLAHDDLFPTAANPNGVMMGAYSFQVAPGALNGQQYQIQLSGASATDDGIGEPGSAVPIFTGVATNASSLGAGTLNGIKNVTVGSILYLVGNVYPFRWFNAGDFGNSNLANADVQQAFEAAAYQINIPLFDIHSKNLVTGGYTNVSDLYDAMDSCGQLGSLDQNPSDANYGYYTNAGPNSLSTGQRGALFSGDYSQVNNMAFGDGNLDISDVYLTFLRSEFTNNFVWFQRMWTNGVRVATATYAPGVIPAVKSRLAGNSFQKASSFSTPAPSSITNTPFINFTAGDTLASPGTNITIPITATTFGAYPTRMFMLNISVVPLDGSPALTVPIQFNPSSALVSAIGSAVPWMSDSSGNGNYSGVWFPNTSSPTTQVPGLSGTATIGTLSVTIPTNATSSSAYAIHFDHASASPSGLLSFPNRKLTGLITLSSRTNSYYSDGIPDSWRLRYFGTIYNDLSVSNANADGTCMNNWQKYVAGLDPTDPTSLLNEGTDQPMAQNQQDFVLYWPTVSGKTYIVQRSANLFPPKWISISTNSGTGTYMEIHDSGAANGYYRVSAQ